MNMEWMLIRGAGFAAYGLLAAATIWGLILSLGVLPRATKRLTFVHESLSMGALLATGVHMVALYLHDFVEFDAQDVLVPGASGWRPLAVAWGVVAFYGMIVVIASFYLRKYIGQRHWRLLHFASLGVFLGAMVHGIAAGTDSSHPAALSMYVASAAIVVGLTTMRVAMVLSPSQPAPRAARRGGDRSERTAVEAPAPADA